MTRPKQQPGAGLPTSPGPTRATRPSRQPAGPCGVEPLSRRRPCSRASTRARLPPTPTKFSVISESGEPPGRARRGSACTSGGSSDSSRWAVLDPQLPRGRRRSAACRTSSSRPWRRRRRSPRPPPWPAPPRSAGPRDGPTSLDRQHGDRDPATSSSARRAAAEGRRSCRDPNRHRGSRKYSCPVVPAHRAQGRRRARPRKHARELRRCGRGRASTRSSSTSSGRGRDFAAAPTGARAAPGLRDAAGPLLVAHDWGDAVRREAAHARREALDAFMPPAARPRSGSTSTSRSPAARTRSSPRSRARPAERAMASTMEVASLAYLRDEAPELERGWTLPRVSRDWSAQPWCARCSSPARPAARAPAGDRAPPRARARRLGDLGLPPAHHSAGGRRPRTRSASPFAWTVDEADRIARLRALGVDGI